LLARTAALLTAQSLRWTPTLRLKNWKFIL